MAVITSTGLGSGLDINSMVSKLVAAERTPKASRLDGQEAKLQAKISGLGTVKGALSDFRNSLDDLRVSSTFEKLEASTSDPLIVSASASGNADLANYQLDVKQLAQPHALATKTFSSASDLVGTGTLTIKFGATSYDGSTDAYTAFSQNAEKGTLSLTIDSSNNSLGGIRDAINNAKAGVTASIINDGTGYRLVLNAEDSGARNSLQVSVADGDGADIDDSGLSALAFNASATQMIQTQNAQDAIVNINGLDITNSSNTVSSALKGVTLILAQAQPGKLVSLSVEQSNGEITKAAEAFVEKFNEVINTVKKLSSYDAQAKKGGTLMGEASVRGAMAQLRSLMREKVEGLGGTISTLAEIGIETQSDGKLALDSTQFEAALEKNRDDVIAIFADMGSPSHDGVAFIENTGATQAGSYNVSITAAATHGELAGAMSPSLGVDGSNNMLRIKVDGILSGQITLTENNAYTASQLAAELQSRINGDSSLKDAGAGVSVQYDSSANQFTIRSQSYGDTSLVEITQIGAIGSGSTIAGFGIGAGSVGWNVAGTIDGQTGEGKGRNLTAISGAASGLKVQTTDDLTGSRGTVRFTRGLIDRLDNVLKGILDEGSIDARTEGLQKSVDKIGQERTALDDRLEKLQQRLLDRFNAMDRLVGQLQSTSTYLAQQLGALPYAQSNQK